jgi:hypothetical protein
MSQGLGLQNQGSTALEMRRQGRPRIFKKH